MSYKTLQTNGNFIDNIAEKEKKNLENEGERTALLH